MNNIYYDPEKFGLTPIGEVEFSSGSYEFNLFVVWRDLSGTYLWGRDSGCSCPLPFELQGIDSLDRGTAHAAAAAIQEALASRDSYEVEQGYGEAAAVDLIARLRQRPEPTA